MGSSAIFFDGALDTMQFWSEKSWNKVLFTLPYLWIYSDVSSSPSRKDSFYFKNVNYTRKTSVSARRGNSKISFEANGNSGSYFIPLKESPPDTVAPAVSTINETNETHMNSSSVCPQTNKNLQISEAIQMQIEVQRRLHEQLEVQRHLQLRIEAQGKYLQSVLEKAQETLGRQNLGAVGLEAAKVQLSELVSKVSTHCLNSAFLGVKDGSMHTNQPTDCSIDSCLTYVEGQPTEQEMIGLTLLKSKKIDNEPELSASDLSMSVGGLKSSEWNASRSYTEERFVGMGENVILMDQTNQRNTDFVKEENCEMPQKLQFPYFGQKLDLNAHDHGNDPASSSKHFDLNGLSW
ncbi:hypothetical protein E3N88_14678 [Mikania micrantha]|uniref:MYB-CC type transcription factor LHEQLE-containing domain-containing protein n=1 Tax=Mikania micrantha TaxID=192012 RepID=A0A5N6P3D5_9ASTR|nr:hypothetical protein E3N88_14678 [Mikania micrantha]